MKTMKSSLAALAGQLFSAAKDATYYTAFGIQAFGKMNTLVSVFPLANYLFLPTAAAFAVFSFGFNLLAKWNTKHSEGAMSWLALGVQGLLSIGIVVGTIVTYLLSSFMGTVLFTVSLGISALYQLGSAIQQLYQAYDSHGEVRKAHLHAAFEHLLNFIGAGVISAGLMIAEVLGLTKIVNLVLFVINVPLLMRSMYDLIKNHSATQPNVDASAIKKNEEVWEPASVASVSLTSLSLGEQPSQQSAPEQTGAHSQSLWQEDVPVSPLASNADVSGPPQVSLPLS